MRVRSSDYPLCRHIKTNGIQCKSPALTAGLYCFFHKRLYARHNPFRNTPVGHAAMIPGHHIQLEPLEDSESVQIALSVVINALPPASSNPAAPPRSSTASR